MYLWCERSISMAVNVPKKTSSVLNSIRIKSLAFFSCNNFSDNICQEIEKEKGTYTRKRVKDRGR